MGDDNSAYTPLIENQKHSQCSEGSIGDHRGHVGVVREFGNESKRLWKLAGPAIFTLLCQYSLGALTQTFAGFVGELELAAVSVENSVIAGFAFGFMVPPFPTFFVFLLAASIVRN